MKFFLILILTLFSFSSAALKRIDIMAHNSVGLYGAIKPGDETFLLSLKAAVLGRKNKTYPIYVVINSGGGSVRDGALFAHEATKHKNINVVVIRAYSMAANIVQLIPEAKRYYQKDSEFLYHPMKHKIFNIGTIELLDYVQRMFQAEKLINQAIINRLGVSAMDFYTKVHVDKILKEKKIKEFNLADELVEIRCSDAARVTKVPYVTQQGMVMTSLCPLDN